MKLLSWKLNFGCCLGNTIILPSNYTMTTYKHEYGHHLQFLSYGRLKYIFKVCIPSFTFWWIDVLFHKKWTNKARIFWYYNLPWESEADRLGNVNRFH